MKLIDRTLALIALLVMWLSSLVDERLLGGMPAHLRTVGAVGPLTRIRLLNDMGYGDLALSKGDILDVARGKKSIDRDTAELWVRAGLAIDVVDLGDEAEAPVPPRSQVVVHERGGMELLQAATSITPGGQRVGPAEENPTDSDPEEDAEGGRARTNAGVVIEENADGGGNVAASDESAAKPKSGRRSK